MEVELSEDMRFQYGYAFRYLDAVIKKVGREKFFTGGEYKRYKEFFIGAIIAQYLTELSTVCHYVVSVDEGNDPPDFMVRFLNKNSDASDKTEEVSYPFEMVDYTKHSNSVEEVIDGKLAANYPEAYNIVVFFKHDTETTFPYQALRKKYQKETRKIFLVARTKETASGLTLPEEKWIVVPLNGQLPQKILRPSRSLIAGHEPLWRQKGRGRDKIWEVKEVKIKLPK